MHSCEKCDRNTDFGTHSFSSAYPMILEPSQKFSLKIPMAVFFLMNWSRITYEKWILGESEMVHEMDQIFTDFD